MNGDGMADLVGFKSDGVWVALSTGRSFAPATLWSTSYSAGSGGWSSYDLYPRALGDVDGSGRAAIVGFGGRKTYVTRYDHQVRMYYDADGNRVVSINDGARATFTWAIGSKRGRRITTWAGSGWPSAPRAA
jgi:hypothetical protein